MRAFALFVGLLVATVGGADRRTEAYRPGAEFEMSFYAKYLKLEGSTYTVYTPPGDLAGSPPGMKEVFRVPLIQYNDAFGSPTAAAVGIVKVDTATKRGDTMHYLLTVIAPGDATHMEGVHQFDAQPHPDPPADGEEEEMGHATSMGGHDEKADPHDF